MNESTVQNLINMQRIYFNKGETKDISFRKKNLKILLSLIKKYEDEILESLYADLKKPTFEGFMSEIGIVYSELRYVKRHLRCWARPKFVLGGWLNLFAINKIYTEPKGVVLIIGPWNYPFQLLISPLIGAIAAGNCAILKPSEFAPATSAITSKIINEGFDPKYISVVEGGVEVGQELVRQRFDHIFYTGGIDVGKLIMKEASDRLTPVTLELGGKSPCIVDKSADVELAAKRIVWGKFWNAGQTCIAPDYLLVHETIKEELKERMIECIEKFWGDEPDKSKDYARIVNSRHFARLEKLMKNGKIVVGGKSSLSDRYIAPTIIENVDLNSPIMKEEIFGPLLPILEFREVEECIKMVNENPNPLALYCFSGDNSFQEKIIKDVSFGGGCINDLFLQVTNPRLPFGGVGSSGFGSYHGKYSFKVFTHFKPVVKSSIFNEIWPKYPTYGSIGKIVSKIMRSV